MSDDSRIQQLVEEVLDSGRSPEEVCADSPELVWHVMEGVRQCRALEARIEAMFPRSGKGVNARHLLAAAAGDALPQVPGYQVEEVLGRGGVGVVYRARHLKLNRYVALKMLLSGAYADRRELARFTREAEAVAGFRHAHIVQVYDVGECDGKPYFTMEYMEGGSLAQKLAGTPQPAAQAALLLLTLSAAVHVAHAGGIVHRDLKPSNILLTSDGTPKISDFGLARRIAGDVTVTEAAAHVGTPSYMAPEQALGKAIGPATDVYGLGAVLYELLTGRPPFRAESASETERQLISTEPAAPSRLNAKVPRDLETVCLKCLRKEPDRRYTSAAALADDLRAFLEGRPISARRVGLPERAAKWVRRRPAVAVAVAAAVVAATTALGAGLWLASSRAATIRAAEGEWRDAVKSQRAADWPAAGAALDRAKIHLGPRAAGDLRRRLEDAARDAKLVAELEALRVARAAANDTAERDGEIERRYQAAFTAAGLPGVGGDPGAAAERVRSSNVRAALVAGLDDWALCAVDGSRRRWLLNVSRDADLDPTGWRGRVRTAWGDPPTLAGLLGEAVVEDQPVPFLIAAARQLNASGNDPIPFLTRVQRAHPGDFWTSFSLGQMLLAKGDGERSARYQQAAVALRPGVAAVHNGLGLALMFGNHFDEAATEYREALRLDPDENAARVNLGVALAKGGDRAGALREMEEAVRRQPRHYLAQCRLGDLLLLDGRDEEALPHHREAFALAPSLAATERYMRGSLTCHGQGEAVRAAWQRAVTVDSTGNRLDELGEYAEFCLYIGHADAYRAARRALLEALGANRDPRAGERAGRTCLLLPPGSDDELRRATAAIDAALESDRKTGNKFRPYFLFAKGLAEYRAGRVESAVRILEGEAAPVLGPAPKLVAAMARHRLGQAAEAREALSQAGRSFDWTESAANYREAWMYHVLRREAEALVAQVPQVRPRPRADRDERG